MRIIVGTMEFVDESKVSNLRSDLKQLLASRGHKMVISRKRRLMGLLHFLNLELKKSDLPSFERN